MRFLLCVIVLINTHLCAVEFTVLVYNVENLFDVDGVALYEDYGDNTLNPTAPYTPAKLLTKLENIARVLATVDGGRGPDVILFQEFELDQTPYGSSGDPAALVAPWADLTVGQMLGGDFNQSISNLPAEAFLWKLLEEQGRGGYFVAKPDPTRSVFHPAQCNVVFSRFPFSSIRQLSLAEARDVLIVEIDVDGYPFIVMNNHWKSGASSRRTASTRMQNAQVVRDELESVLSQNPLADVLIAGDLNCYYNQTAVFPEWGPVGINQILGSQTDEVGLVEGTGPVLYNLWGELPLDERGSDVYQGKWGTLMQMLITRGLYDAAGVQYADNSFFRLAIPGMNIEPIWGQPIRWAGIGGGSGFSDHLPIGARFRTVVTNDQARFIALEMGTRECTPPADQPVVNYASLPPGQYPNAEKIASLSPDDQARALGRIFEIHGTVSRDGRRLEVGDTVYGVYFPDRKMRDRWNSLKPSSPVHFFGEFNVFRGARQFIVHDASWWR